MDKIIEGSPLVTLNQSEQKAADKLITLWKKDKANKVISTFSFIKFGILAIETKIAHPKSFNRMADYEEHIPKKQLHRAMKLVMENPKDLRKGLTVSGKNTDIAKNIALLVIDPKMQSITLESLSNMKDISIKKIEKIKLNLDIDAFNSVLSGDNTAYDSIISKENSDNEEANNKKHYSHMPEGFEDKVLFDNLTSSGVYELTTQVLENMNSIAELETKNNELKTKNTNLELELAKFKGKLEVYATLPVAKANLFPNNEKNNKRVA